MSVYGVSVQVKGSGFVTFRSLTQHSRKVSVTWTGHSRLIRLWETIKILAEPVAKAVMDMGRSYIGSCSLLCNRWYESRHTSLLSPSFMCQRRVDACPARKVYVDDSSNKMDATTAELVLSPTGPYDFCRFWEMAALELLHAFSNSP